MPGHAYVANPTDGQLLAAILWGKPELTMAFAEAWVRYLPHADRAPIVNFHLYCISKGSK